METKNLNLDKGAHQMLLLLAGLAGIPIKTYNEQLIAADFIAKFGDVDPATVRIERTVVKVGEQP